MMLSRLLLAFFLICCAPLARAEPLSSEVLADLVVPPFQLGTQVNDKGVWTILNAGGAEAGFVFETEPLAPLPGFSGAAINVLVTLDLEGRFMDVRLLEHNEPIFVSGLGEAPFRAFFEQYPGLSISDTVVVGTPYGGATDGSGLVYLDGVTKATASVRIAHESVLAATLQVAREKMQGVSAGPPARPDPAYDEDLTFDTMLAQGLITRLTVSNAEIQAEFTGTLWERDDPEAVAEPDAPYLDLWIADLGPPALARALLDEDGLAELARFMEIADHDAPILVVETARHGLVSEEFVRNTSPDWLSASQDGLPVALRDSDLDLRLHPDLPDALHDAADFGAALILRTDRRLGFDPTRDWTLNVQAVRSHGILKPEIGTVTLSTDVVTPERFYTRPEVPRQLSPAAEALRGRATDLAVLGVGLIGLGVLLGPGLSRFAGSNSMQSARLAILAAMTIFVGFWGQGQLSIVTVLATLRTALDGASFAFLLYDPFSLLVWAAAIVGFVLWGRGLFCGWLCPFGALQEFADRIGRLLRLPQIEPNAAWDAHLRLVKYGVLAALVAVALWAPHHIDKAAEVEPFKTAITVYFVREWYYVAYAALWLLLGMVLFKGFCRYVCPLGAVMAIGGMIRGRDWIARRAECGSPCQLCKVKCRYKAIAPTGKVAYDECFGCLDCVQIYEAEERCVPLVLAARGAGRRPGRAEVAAE
ncbi:4Fe-4S binding protein [Tropicimonas sp. S265A]|uniref:4Fe-4S binding protein n=1 Tax=Tropicimonas sp. S265A TaxID=3415134 RepID=UPI003C7BDCD8